MKGRSGAGLKKLKKIIVKVTKCMDFLHQITPILPRNELRSDEKLPTTSVPKGHFVVLAGKREDDEMSYGCEDEGRFVLELKYLKSPSVLKLFQEAEEEYGFHQQGSLVLPCTPQHLSQILRDNL